MFVEPSTLILSPHCDDAPLSMGASLLTRNPSHPTRVSIVFSRSRCTKEFPCNGPEEQVTQLRHREEMQAAQIAGYGLDFWGFGEPFVRPGFQQVADIFDLRRPLAHESVWEHLLAAVDRAVCSHTGLLVAPLGCGGHIDHRIVRAAVLACWTRYPHLRVGFYEDLPYCHSLSDAQILAALPVVADRSFQPHIVSEGLGPKLALLEVYRSQLSDGHLWAVKAYWARRGGERLWIAGSVD
jgi:LmbE family N-acetylglucosaminyl deacetylase